ncbi:hypothetical protein SUGI_0520690 [Cryptomeria japonica]|nr:hypothetical protein SUGI_0520690 [Cryptomeria japonica]
MNSAILQVCFKCILRTNPLIRCATARLEQRAFIICKSWVIPHVINWNLWSLGTSLYCLLEDVDAWQHGLVSAQILVI